MTVIGRLVWVIVIEFGHRCLLRVCGEHPLSVRIANPI